MKILVVTAEPITADALRRSLGDGAELERAEVMVVAPALQENPLKFWLSDADKAIARAEAVRRESVERLGDEGVSASGDTGESDPLLAIQDALQTFLADRIVLFTGEGRYREGIEAAEVQERFGIETVQV